MYEKLDMMLMFVPALKAASPPSSSCAPLPDVTGKDVVELGCGTAYFGAWLKKAGVGVDTTNAWVQKAFRPAGS
jgi:SAM-dependent methyltransferase